MTAPLRRRPSVRQIALSTLLVLAMVCLIAGVVMAISFAANVDDPTVSTGEWTTMVILSMLLYGPMMVITGWPITIPVTLLLGPLLAHLRLRYRRDRKPPAAARTVLIVLLGYAGVTVLTWAVLLFAARGLR